MKRKREENMAGSCSSSYPYFIVDDNDADDNISLSSDEIYARQLQLQETLISVSSSSSSSPKQPSMMAMASSESSKFCDICMDTKPSSEMFRNTKVCSHSFCSNCIRRHIAAKIKENQTTVKCPDPDCKRVIGPEVCRSIVPKEVLDRWDDILCESMISESDKFYCPFKDCSAMMVVDDGDVDVTSSECPSCNRLFCAQCKVAWHCGMNCREFQSMKKGEGNPDDSLLIKLAKKKKWMKCSKCNFFVEKVDGCQHIACRCGHHFCYKCGKPYQSEAGHTCRSKVK